MGSAGAEDCYFGRGAAVPGSRAGWCGDTEVTADVSDDVGGGTLSDVVIEIRAVEPVEELGMQAFGFDAAGGALDRVFNRADDAGAGGGAMVVQMTGGVRWRGFGDFAGEGYAAADGAGDAVEGDGAVRTHGA